MFLFSTEDTLLKRDGNNDPARSKTNDGEGPAEPSRRVRRRSAPRVTTETVADYPHFITIKAISGPNRGLKTHITAAVATIGRKGCGVTIPLNDRLVSPRHR